MSCAGVPDISKIIEMLERWGESDALVLSILLVGSYARKDYNPSSDIDIVVIVKEMTPFLLVNSWAQRFGSVDRILNEDWGLVKVRRIFYKSNIEMEFGFTTSKWLELPLDEGTRNVLNGGYLIVYDPTRVSSHATAFL